MSFEKHVSKHPKGLRPYRVSADVNSAVIFEYLQALDCPRSLTVAILLRNKEFEQLANLEFDPLNYLTITELRDSYAATKFLSKYADFDLPYDLDDVAFTKFKKFEDGCKVTNSRFRNLSMDPQFNGSVVWLHNAIIRKIERLLGEFDPEEFFDMANWGPGATTLLKVQESSAANKFQCETGITRDLYALISDSLLERKYPLWYGHLRAGKFPTFQVGNKVVTVPKDSTANRVIAIEPGINLWFQKAIGQMMRRRLLRSGIDLRYQSTNQNAARVGSIDSSLATIDFSSASDSISKGVVEALLPPRWYLMMDTCRSHFGVLDKEQVRWNKFSSMGNGFTFELETLIFYAIAFCCVEYLQLGSYALNRITVYGDDVILPTQCLELFAKMCSFYGFTMNMKKSHFSSMFRESCGKHYYLGVDVTPIYLKGRLSNVLTVYRLANAIRRLAHRRNSYGCDARFRRVFDHLVNSVPKSYRFRIPETLGDGGFISNLDEATPVRCRHGIEGYRVRNLIEASSPRLFDGIGLLLTRLWVPTLDYENIHNQQTQAILPSTLSRGNLFRMVSRDVASPLDTGNLVSIRNRVKVKLVNSIVPQWYDLGPWI